MEAPCFGDLKKNQSPPIDIELVVKDNWELTEYIRKSELERKGFSDKNLKRLKRFFET